MRLDVAKDESGMTKRNPFSRSGFILQKFEQHKHRENAAVSYCLAIINFNFTRKICKNSKHIKFVKMLRFGTVWLLSTSI